MRDWWLPALFAAGQLLYWPGLATEPEPARVAVVAGAVAVVTVALGLRRRAPVTVTVVVAAAIGTGGLASGDSLVVLDLADFAALFSVAVLRDRRTALLTAAGLAAALALFDLLGDDSPGELIGDVLLSGALYALVVVLGRIRGRWLADREAAARRLAEARSAEREAARAERARLARELHDVTAHHLTSIVVGASAAQALAGRRPELAAEALTYAASAGRETLASLHRLVAVLPAADEETLDPADLVDDFRLLGQLVTLERTGDPEPDVARAVYGILREALTNTLRYAPGAPVRVRINGLELLVENDAGAEPGAASGLGGGRGVAGMRERAEALGGTLTAGPRGDGWLVHASFPAAGVALARRSPFALDLALAAATAFPPLLAAGFSNLPPVLYLLAVVHSAPLLQRRRRPWWTLAAVLATGPVILLLVALRWLPVEGAAWIALGGGAELAAIYAVAAWSGRLSALAPLVVTVAGAIMAGLAFLRAATLPTVLTSVVAFVLIGLLFAVLLGTVATASWLAGHTARRRRARRREREELAVDDVVTRAELRALGERIRMGHDLRAAVLRHAAQVPLAADRADLAAVVDSARQALSAMRTLLKEKENPPSSPE